ncbi:ABC superfamily atp binding cassette transporter permease protein [Fusarium austroafricanum]|uniref:ABC superfamily atp binding cassette transporter permease protein n=1 Tax=Fusarium austroafricanum TaxID=2364996 RepID=A0A8H4JZN1_9HYPO|nr:ABC superfamily atp binding cassette transporter permease protein [Fusarium austroafricanum]
MLDNSLSEFYYTALTNRFALDNTPLLAAAGASFFIGYLQYAYAIKLMLRDSRGPIPFWMHLFYLAHDASFSYTIGSAAGRYNNHPYLRGSSIAYGVWCILEIYCIYNAIRYHRQLDLSPYIGRHSDSLGTVLQYTFFMLIAMYCTVDLMVELMGGPGCILHWACLTNVLMIVGPTHEFLRRGSRDGLAVGFCVVNVFCSISTFAPFGMWIQGLPEVFDKPVFYWVGCFLFGYSLWLLSIVASYPPKLNTKSNSKKLA